MDETKKTCKLCCMPIPARARKCPHCHHLQDKLSTVMYHPASMVVLMAIVLMFFGLMMDRLYDRGVPFSMVSSPLRVVETQVVFGETKCSGTVAVLGTITNTGAIPWKGIHIQVEFRDAVGRLVDAKQQYGYTDYLPPHAALPFKLSFPREFPETNYVSHVVWVVQAEDGRARF